MKIAHYSDLHCEFGNSRSIPSDLDADVIVLAGDIISLGHFGHMRDLLARCKKPVVYVMGNHEHYGCRLTQQRVSEFRDWAARTLPNLHVLERESLVIGGVSFFGGTMWTDFAGLKADEILRIERNIPDFFSIYDDQGKSLTTRVCANMHRDFRKDLLRWLKKTAGPRVVVTHHAPAINPATRFLSSPLSAAFNCSDMAGTIEKFAPEYWIYGHTHEPGDYRIGKTRCVSNPLGYWQDAMFEVEDFDPYGAVFEIAPAG